MSQAHIDSVEYGLKLLDDCKSKTSIIGLPEGDAGKELSLEVECECVVLRSADGEPQRDEITISEVYLCGERLPDIVSEPIIAWIMERAYIGD